MQNRIPLLAATTVSCMHSAADSSSKMPHFCPNIDRFSFNKIPTQYVHTLVIWNEIKMQQNFQVNTSIVCVCVLVLGRT